MSPGIQLNTNRNFLKVVGGNLVKEVWVDVEGCEGQYAVSNLGRVKSFIAKKSGRYGDKKEVFLKTRKTAEGYICVSIHGSPQQLHRIIATAFICNKESKPYINHINGIKTDNSVSNLEWCTPGENQKHAYSIGLRTSKGESNGRSKLNTFQVQRIRLMREITPFLSYREIGKMFSVGKTAIFKIIKKNTWKHI